MLKDVVAVQAVADHRLWIRFEDGVEGELDFRQVLKFHGVFAPLADPAEFARVAVHPEFGCLFWPNGADVCPDVLYSFVTTAKRPDLTRGKSK